MLSASRNGCQSPDPRHSRSGRLWRASVTRPARGLVALSLVVMASLIFSASASAAITHKPESFSPLDGSGFGQSLASPNKLAIDEATGNLFVINSEGISILGGEGGPPAGLEAPYEISPASANAITYQSSIAYDNSPSSPARGTLYLYEVGASVVSRYTRNPASERYELAAGGIAVPVSEKVGSLSVDGAGNLYVSVSNELGLGVPDVQKFSPSGSLLEEYDLSASPIRPGTSSDSRLKGALVDEAGDLFISGEQRNQTSLEKFAAGPSGSPDLSSYTELLSPPLYLSFYSGLALDQAGDRLFAGVGEGTAEFDTTTGDLLDVFGSQNPGGAIVDSSADLIYVADPDANSIDVFGPPVLLPTLRVGPASGVTGTKATLAGSVNPVGIEVEECFFEWGEDENGAPHYEHKSACEGEIGKDSSTYTVRAQISGLTSNGVVYHYRLVAKNENGTERTPDRTLQTAATVVSRPATGIGQKAATLNGVVRPEGLQYTSCVFEYGLTTNAGFENTGPCDPGAEEIGADFESHAVSAAVANLNPNSTYKFRITAANSAGTLSGQTLTFATIGPPLITEVRARDADQGSATIEAQVNPSGFGTTYRFEWGRTSAYGNRVPADVDLFAGSGAEPLRVSARISGLSPGTVYHYRVVATSTAGTTDSPDRLVETIDSCGLPDGRCFELVSPRDVGPTDLPGTAAGSEGKELHFQASSRPGAFAYVSETGLPSATKGAEVLSKAVRDPGGWESSQLSPAVTDVNEKFGSSSASSEYRALNEELTCGVVASNQQLTDDPRVKETFELGGESLYLQGPDGRFTLLTRQVPTNAAVLGEKLGGSFFFIRAISADCSKVEFETQYTYPGIPTVARADGKKLYEWDDGTLRNVSQVPGETGEMPASGEFDAASADGSRVFFSNEEGIFVREDGSTTRKISVSATSTPVVNPQFQSATSDGTVAFFTANVGLSAESSLEGTDLYKYDLETGVLTDVSPNSLEAVTDVPIFVGSSADGAVVYFAAQGQLVPGAGDTFAANRSAGTESIYREQGGHLRFVASIDVKPVFLGPGKFQTSQVSPDGRYLLFESIGNVTGYEGGSAPEAYLYDNAAAAEATVCISCRHDGGGSATPPTVHTLASAGKPANSLSAPRSLVEVAGRPLVFFNSFDSLAPGAVENGGNVYEWAHNQVFLVAAEPPGLQAVPAGTFSEFQVPFVGASEDGTDLYFVTPQTLTWEDGDERASVYDARVGGGFPAPPPPTPPCNPSVEGSCQGSANVAGTTPSPSSQNFIGPGNATQKHKKKYYKKKHHKNKRKRGADHGRRTSK